MPIQVVCSNAQCRKPLKVRDELADKKVKCPKCETVTQVTEDRVLPFLQLGSYSLVRKIGEGGMGSVYEGVQTKLDRQVALKVLPKSRTEDTAFLERFEREAKAAAALNHPNIVQVYDIGEDHGSHFFAMEFVDGEDLSQRLERDTKLPLEDGLSIVQSVAKALQFAHSRTIIHRDIKPDNIMVSREGEIKLADMGLAKSVEEEKGVTATGVGLGTPYYMAPEQAEDASRADHRSDIYALGITMMHLLTGKRPFDGPTAVSVILAHREQSLPTGKDLGTELPPNVEALIRKMAATDPNKRYAGYDALLADLEKVTSGERIAGQLPIGRSKLSKIREAPTVAGPRLAKTQADDKPQKSKGPIVAVVAALALVVAGGIYFATRGSPKRQIAQVATTTVKPAQQGTASTPEVPEIQPFADADLEAIRLEQKLMDRAQGKTDTAARKQAKEYDYRGALKQYDILKADPRFSLRQNVLDNQKEVIKAAAAVFYSAHKEFSKYIGKPIQLGGKTHTLKSYNQVQLVLESGGKETEMPLRELKASDVFRLALPAQEQLGADGCVNLFRFALISGDEAMIPKVNALAKKLKVKIGEGPLAARMKPILMVSTTPIGALVRVLSRDPNPYNRPFDSKPFLTIGVRDAKLNTTYVLEISKKGYTTVKHTVQVAGPGTTVVNLTLKKRQAVAKAGEPDDRELAALRQQQEKTFKRSKKLRDEARKLTHRYDYAAALRKYDELAAVPEMKNQQNFVANGRKDVEQGAKVFAAALKAINHYVGKPITLSKKTYTLKSFDNRKLVLDSAGKEIEMNVTELSGLDVFRLASPEQKKLGTDGWNNLWRFAAGSRDMGALMPRFLKEFRQAGVETQNAVGAKGKPVLSVGTTPFGATVRFKSRSPNPKGLPVDSTPWFTSYSSTALRDVDPNTTYVLEFSKKGYQTVERTVKVEKGAVTGVFLFLLKSELAEDFALPTDKNDQHGNPVRQRLDKETNYPLEIVHKRTGMSFVFIKPGEFKTDSVVNNPQSPRKTIHITRPYYIGKYEVTVNEWKQIQSGDPGEQNRKPAGSITSDARRNFLAKLNELLTDRQEKPPVQFAYPSESQWEYACRAGTTTDHSFGKETSHKIVDQFAWYGGNSKREYQKVGQKKPNPWGLYDMHGSLWEWVRIWEGDPLSKRSGIQKPAKASEKNRRILRGGSIWDPIKMISSSYVRTEYLPQGHRDALMGIRVSLRLGAFYEPPQAHPSREKDGDAGLQALRRQQEQAYALSRKTDAEAWKLASQHDYGGAKKLYEKLAADPRFKHMQNSIANQKQSVRDASEAYSFAMSGISTHFMGKTPITLGGKQYKIVGAKAGQLTLESGGKTTFMAIKDISGLDLFRLAYPGQKERGIEGYINLYRFAVMASDAKSLVPIVDKKLKDEDVDIHEAIIAILKPTLMVMTKPSRATIRVRSRNPNLDNRPVDSTPFFSVGMRDAKLNTTYVLEISKEGFETIEHEVKVTKPGPTVVSLVLKPSQKKGDPNKLDDSKLETLRQKQKQIEELLSRTHEEAWEHALQYDFAEATEKLEALARDSRFKNLQNKIANMKVVIDSSSEVYTSALSTLRAVVGRPREFGGKGFVIEGINEAHLTLKPRDGDKQILLPLKNLEGKDVFGLALSRQRKRGPDGYVNLWQFVRKYCPGRMGYFAAMAKKSEVDVAKHELNRLKPTLVINTEPQAATIRIGIKSQAPNSKGQRAVPAPLFSPGTRDAQLETEYVLEISKKGYETVEYTAKVTKPGTTQVNVTLKKAPQEEDPNKLDDPKHEALRRQQRKFEEESVRKHGEAIGLAMKYEYAEAIKRLNALAKDPRFRKRRHEIHNNKVGIEAAEKVYQSALKALKDQVGKPMILDGKTVDVTQFNGRQVILKSGGKVITKSVMKLKHGDVFRLAAPGQQKLGVEGYANLWQFALNAGGARKDLFPIVTEMVKAAKVDITAVEMQRLKPVFLVKTQPQGATIRMRSYEHDQNTQAPWLEPGTNEPPVLFSPFSRDATLDRTYILEISKKGYLTVDHGVRIQRTGRQFIDVKLKKAEGFVNLFAGEAARGWVQCGPGEFQFGHGLATATGGMGLWWYKPKEFINFVLRLEYVLQENANSGVFLRFPAPGNDPENALRDGYEVAILKVPGRASGIETGGSTGSIFAFKSPWSFPQRPAQKWNSMEITCVEQDYFVRLNGELVNHFVGDRKLSGHIGLQNYRTLVSFRNVHIKELKGAEGYNEMVKLSREIEAAKKE